MFQQLNLEPPVQVLLSVPVLQVAVATAELLKQVVSILLAETLAKILVVTILFP